MSGSCNEGLAKVNADVRLAGMALSSRVLVAAAFAAAAPAVLEARQRTALASDDPRAQVMGYYAATMMMTPVGLTGPGFAVGGELTFLPALSDADRRVGFGGTKLEKTNFCPVLPRLRASLGRGRSAVDVGVLPPLEVCGVQALLVSASVLHRMPLRGQFQLALRAHAVIGTLEAAITCPAEAVADPADQTCYRGNVSEDQVHPLTIGADVMLVHAGDHHPRLDLYALAGVRHDRVGFDVNYERTALPAATLLPVFADHQRYRASYTRLHAAAGAGYRFAGRVSAAGELLYAPGALFTARGRIAYALGSRP